MINYQYSFSEPSYYDILVIDQTFDQNGNETYLRMFADTGQSFYDETTEIVYEYNDDGTLSFTSETLDIYSITTITENQNTITTTTNFDYTFNSDENIDTILETITITDENCTESPCQTTLETSERNHQYQYDDFQNPIKIKLFPMLMRL